jgi:hypothetical protein
MDMPQIWAQYVVHCELPVGVPCHCITRIHAGVRQFNFCSQSQALVMTDARRTSLSSDILTRLVFIDETLSLVRKIRVDGMVDTQISTSLQWHSAHHQLPDSHTILLYLSTGLLKSIFQNTLFLSLVTFTTISCVLKNKFWLSPQANTRFGFASFLLWVI